MKKIRRIKAVWEAPIFLFIKIPFVFVLLNWAYNYYNHFSFNWSNKLETAVGVSFIVLFVYCITSAIPFGNINSSPLFIKDTLFNDIKEFHTHHYTFADKRGVYKLNKVDLVDHKMVYSYRPIHEPLVMLGRIEYQKRVLHLLGSMESEKLLEKISTIEEEVRYMVHNQEEIIDFDR